MSIPHRSYVVEDGGSLWDRNPIPGAEIHLLVGKEQSEGSYSLVRCLMGSSIPEHVHQHDDESIYLLEGEMTAQIEDEKVRMSAGDFLYLPRQKRHQLIIESPIKMLNIQTPGGIMDGLMGDVIKHMAAGNELDTDTYVEIQRKYGVEAPSGWVAEG